MVPFLLPFLPPCWRGTANRTPASAASEPAPSPPCTASRRRSGAVPAASTLGLGEELINTYDGKVYFKKSVGGVDTVLVLVGQNPLGSSSPMWTADPNLMWTQ